MKLLAFCGRRYTGKDYCADLVMQLNSDFHKVSFAEILKIEFADLVGIDAEDLSKPTIKETYRHDLIAFAESKKAKDPAYWAKRLFTILEDVDHPVVISDLRFIEELELVVKNKGVVYKIQAEPEVRKARGWNPNPLIDNDRSEVEMDLSSYTFYKLTGGGSLFNNELAGDNLIRKQVYDVLNRHFSV